MNKLTRRQIAIAASVAFHVVLLIVLFFWYVPRRSESGASETQPTADTQPPEPRREVPKALAEVAAAEADVSDEEVERSIDSQIEQMERLPDERKLSELEKNLKRLDSIANPESVERVSTKIAGSLGLDTEMYAAKEASAGGSFDIDSSQLSDVTRSKGDDGTWTYESLMVDAEGREMRVPLTAAEGEQLYDTFQLMKQYPMAGGIYRGIVMPMMQKMLEAEAAARSAESDGSAGSPSVGSD